MQPLEELIQTLPIITKEDGRIHEVQKNQCHPFANRSFQPRPNIVVGKHNLVPYTMPNRVKPSQPRKINVRPLPEATQWNWLGTLKAKEAAGATISLAPTQTSQLVNTPSMLCPTYPIPPNTEHTNYCAFCTPLGKICLNEFPMSLNWDDDDEEEERKYQKKRSRSRRQ